MANVSFLVVIPARYQSTRFPGKPLADLGGSPLIEHVWRRCCEAVDPERVIIATDDDRIREVAQAFGARVEMTSPDCLTGTDRVAEVAGRHDADWYINVQGDEPFVDPAAINAIIERSHALNDGTVAVNAKSQIARIDDFLSPMVPKVVTNADGYLLYISRSPIPISKSGQFHTGYRQLGLYAFSRRALRHYGVNQKKSRLESIEDIEILRLLEVGENVEIIELPEPGLAVDSLDDLDRARNLLETNGPADLLPSVEIE